MQIPPAPTGGFDLKDRDWQLNPVTHFFAFKVDPPQLMYGRDMP